MRNEYKEIRLLLTCVSEEVNYYIENNKLVLSNLDEKSIDNLREMVEEDPQLEEYLEEKILKIIR